MGIIEGIGDYLSGLFETARPTTFVFPDDILTPDQELRYLLRLKENLRLWHNQQCEGKDSISASKFFKEKFYAKSAELERLINDRATYIYNEDELVSLKNKPEMLDIHAPLSDLDYIGDRVADIFDPIEDFTAYTEVDPNNRYAVTANKIDVTALTRDETAHVYKDFGANHFNGNFTQLFEAYIASTSTVGGTAYACVKSNDLDNMNALLSGNKPVLTTTLQKAASTYPFSIQEFYNGSSYFDSDNLSANTLYYFTVVRDESIGANGTYYQYIYSDANRTVLVASQSLALHAKIDFRYIMAINSGDANQAAQTFTGYMQNLDLQEVAPNAANTPLNIIRPTRHYQSVALGNSRLHTLLSDGLVGYWRFEELLWNGTAGEVKDISGKGNHGTAAGGITTIAAGKLGRGSDNFDGANDAISIPYSSSLDVIRDMTILAWALNIPDAGRHPIMEARSTEVNAPYVFHINNWGFYFAHYNGTGWDTVTAASPVETLTSGKQYLLGVRRRGLKIDFIMNAFLTAPTAVTGYAAANPATDKLIGAGFSSGAVFSKIKLDEVAIWNRALDDSEISRIYNHSEGMAVI